MNQQQNHPRRMQAWGLVAALLLAATASEAGGVGEGRSSDPHEQQLPQPLLDSSNIPDLPLGSPDTIDNDIPGEPLSPDDFETSHDMVHEALDVSTSADPIELAGLFQGDIVLNSLDELVDLSAQQDSVAQDTKNAIINLKRRWPNGVIPYVISSSYNKNERATIAMAMGSYHQKTCLRFVPRMMERDYIHIIKGDGCSSSVGRVGGAQAVSLGPGCLYVGIVMHELMHAAGFWHEQSRADRDNYITINMANIQNGMEFNFQKYSWSTIQSLGVDYDLESVMHYGPYAFAKDRSKPTIIPRQMGAEIGQRRSLSPKDILKLQLLYNCANTTETITTEVPVTTVAPDTCEDGNKYCETWAAAGECERNPTWMTVSCRKSCKECGKECGDNNKYCNYWARNGQCTKNPSYMSRFCRKSCEICHNEVTESCDDRNRYCLAWAKTGYCRTNADYMLLFCKKSCMQC
ncbi:zinc metalloproteinase nas-4-like [Penaeus indicus]|uniref:zinc metalloproteinase nas-4-like n=1 Tax=Penaeus indicus TaxID=29960 RepID=UPI00300C4A18